MEIRRPDGALATEALEFWSHPSKKALDIKVLGGGNVTPYHWRMQWRAIAAGLALLVPVACIGAARTSAWLVVPPMVAAAVVLMAAAVAVDYFGVARRRSAWAGVGADPRRAWTRARALEHRFARQRAGGSPRTALTARSLLVALAECDRLDDAMAVVDFLGADAMFGRVGADVTADALRAVALAELGRVGEARELCEALDAHRRVRREPVVGYAAARVAELDRRHREAIERVNQVLRSRRLARAAGRDLRMLRARCLAALGRHHDAVGELAELAASGWKREVEQLAGLAHTRGQAALSLAARDALCQATPYR